MSDDKLGESVVERRRCDSLHKRISAIHFSIGIPNAYKILTQSTRRGQRDGCVVPTEQHARAENTIAIVAEIERAALHADDKENVIKVGRLILLG